MAALLATLASAPAMRVSDRSSGDRLDIDGYVHVQWRQDFDLRARPRHGFVLRRARVDFRYEFDRRGAVNLELGADRLELTVKDAFIEYRVGTPLRVTAGLRKMPFSLEELTPARRLMMVERTAVNDAFGRAGFLGRDIGLTIEGEFFERSLPLGYALGVYNGNRARLYRDDNNARQFAQRLTLSPTAGLVLGVNAAQRNDSLTGRLVAAGGADATLALGSLTATAEALFGGLEPGRRALGVGVAGGYRLGALEPVIRVEHLVPDLDNAGRTTILTAGGNWHPHRRLRLKANYSAGFGASPADVALVEAQAGF